MVDEKTFLYSGEGQYGNIKLTKGNKAIIEHKENDKRIILIEYVSIGFVKYIGEMKYKSHRFIKSEDLTGVERVAIVFELIMKR